MRFTVRLECTFAEQRAVCKCIDKFVDDKLKQYVLTDEKEVELAA